MLDRLGSLAFQLKLALPTLRVIAANPSYAAHLPAELANLKDAVEAMVDFLTPERVYGGIIDPAAPTAEDAEHPWMANALATEAN